MKKIKEGDKTVVLPAVLMNEADELWPLNDSAMHQECVDKDARKQKINYALSGALSIFPHDRNCSICKAKIERPDDFIGFGYLTGDQKHTLYTNNFRQFHKKCLSESTELETILSQLDDSLKTGAIKGSGATWLEEQLRNLRG